MSLDRIVRAEPADIDAAVVARAEAVAAPLVVLPVRHVNEQGVYTMTSVLLVKKLRAAGLAAGESAGRFRKLQVRSRERGFGTPQPLTTSFGRVSSALTSVNTDWALPCLSLSSDHNCPCVTVVGRSLSHADRTLCLSAPANATAAPVFRSEPSRGRHGHSTAPVRLISAARAIIEVRPIRFSGWGIT
jgi:hypothetical protein